MSRTRITASLTALAAAGAMSVAAVPTAQAATTSCRVSWGSTDKVINLSSTVTGTLATDVRTGHHTCYDRVVFELAGRTGQTVAGYGGSAATPQYLVVGARTKLVPVGVKPGQVLPTTFRTVRGVVYAGPTEGYEAVAIVTRARLPYRLFVVKGPGSHNRVVVDVAHRW
ncbi:hypothetical protein [Arsenicicoccus dermatophilus]|uniref:AMIN-like domain-containing (lipo)protein n=1 Tax=Arsenicicoccus dermatophilus TaxID=1076331 RepID=UPI0039171E79